MSRLFAFCQLARDLSAPLYRGTVATHQPRPTPKDHPRFNDVFFCCDKLHRNEELLVEWPLASTPPGMPGTHPPIFWLGGRQREYPPNIIRTFGYSRPILVALRSLSLKPFSFGYKTPPIRFSPLPHPTRSVVRPPNLELALTPLRMAVDNKTIAAVDYSDRAK